MLTIQRREESPVLVPCICVLNAFNFPYFFPPSVFLLLSVRLFTLRARALKENRAFVSVLLDTSLIGVFLGVYNNKPHLMGQPVAFIMTLVALCSCFFFFLLTFLNRST